MKIAFWFCLLGIVYTYFGYILLLILFYSKGKIVKRNGNFLPEVSLIIAAYNEEKSIEAKIQNCLKLNFSAEKLEIIVVSDCSDDKTDEIVKKYSSEGVILIRQDIRKGKTAAQNLAVKASRGEILVFSDATTIFEEDSLLKMVRNFYDPDVGLVAGVEKFIKPRESNIAEEVSLFWRYEQLIRKLESRFYSLVAVSGCIFAVRRSLYEFLDKNLVEDFVLPLKTISKGYRVLNEVEAIGYEKAVNSSEEDFERKIRIVIGGLAGIYHMKHLLNPLRDAKLFFQLLSHKIFRWLTPFFLLILFIASTFLIEKGLFYTVAGLLQGIFYLMAVIGYLMRKKRNKALKLFKVTYYFCLINIAAALGVIKFVLGRRQVNWTPIR